MKAMNKIVSGVIIVATISATIVACSSTKKGYTDVPDTETAAAEEEFILEKSGAQHWGETCNRCHIAPSPADYNDTDWETISLHMRVRANLTEDESKKIEEFLKSAN